MFNMFSTLSGKITLYKNSAPDSMNAVTITSVVAFYRMVSDAEYPPVDSCTVVGEFQAPVTVEPHKSCLLSFRVAIPRIERKTDLDTKWWDKEFQGRHRRPIHIKIVVKDIMDEECSLVLEHVFKSMPFLQRNDSDVGFFFLDDPQTYERHVVNVKYGTKEGSVVQLLYYGSSKKLQKVVYHAIKTGNTDGELLSVQGMPPLWEWERLGVGRRIVQASVHHQGHDIKEGSHIPNLCIGCVSYVLCPAYSRVIDEQKEIIYAKETARLPSMTTCTFPEYPQDDDFDDDRPLQSSKLTLGKKGALPNEIVDLTQDLKALQTEMASINAKLQHVTASTDKIMTMATLLFVAIIVRIVF